MADLNRQLRNFIERIRKENEEKHIPNLKEKLQRLYSKSTPVKFMPEEEVVRNYKNISNFINGEWVNTEHGDIFIAKKSIPIHTEYSGKSLKAIFQINDDWLSRLGNFKERKVIDFTQTVFLDTETTGLSLGTGTVAFIVGIGYFSEDKFFIDQYFIDNFNKEPGMLQLISNSLEPFENIITFNGKAFDIPILESRFTINMLKSPFQKLSHLDLLHPARQLWNLELENCKLSTIEERILSIKRGNDLPGEEVPRFYFRYLHTSDPLEVKPIFQHNCQDIISLALTTIALWQHFHNIDPLSDSKLIQKSRAKILAKKGEIEKAISIYEKSLSEELPAYLEKETYIKLGLLYKKTGNLKKMEAFFEKAIEIEIPFYLTPYVELAKLYEHKVKDLQKAYEIIQEALNKISPHKVKEIASLEHRLKRIKRKMGC